MPSPAIIFENCYSANNDKDKANAIREVRSNPFPARPVDCCQEPEHKLDIFGGVEKNPGV
jgi:hypothetical protein